MFAVAVPSRTATLLHHDKIPSLDGLRAISIIIVLLSHCGLQHVIPGRLGVTIFFFLSGYLITTLLLSEHARTGTISIRQFYVRRALRLMPPLIIMLLIAYTLTFLKLLPGSVSVNGLLAQVFYFANYYMIFTPGGGDVPYGTGLLWSLAVEEHFYIVYPLLLLALLTLLKEPRKIALALGIICVSFLAWRFYLILQPGTTEWRLGFASDTRADSLRSGASWRCCVTPSAILARTMSCSGIIGFCWQAAAPCCSRPFSSATGISGRRFDIRSRALPWHPSSMCRSGSHICSHFEY